MRELLMDATHRAASYLEDLDGRSVAPTMEALDRLNELDEPLPDEPTDPAVVLQILDEIGSPATMATAGSRYFGFVIGGSLPATVAANVLAAAWDQNAGLEIASPVAAVLEEISLRWLLDVLALPVNAAGGFTTGATAANFAALAAARHSVLRQSGWDVEAQGLFGAPPITVIVSDEIHASDLKALSLLGLGRERVQRVPVDDQGRIRPEAMPPIDGPTIICLQAGNVNTGAFDPVGEICAYAHPAGAWVHVDGAFGLWAAVAPEKAYLMDGVADADSWATDAHKWLNVPYDSGLVFVRDPLALQASMTTSAAYLIRQRQREPYDYVPEMSRRARGIEIWAAMRSLGRSGLAELIEGCCRHATRLAEGLSAAGYEVLNEVVLNQVLVSFGDAEMTRRVIAGVQNDGTCWCGGTQWQGQTAMRISISSWATTEADIEQSLEAMLQVAKGAG